MTRTRDSSDSGDSSDLGNADARPVRECRDLAVAVEHVDGVDETTVRRAAAARGCEAVSIPESHDRAVFEVTSLDCPTCSALVETAIGEVDGVSNVSASDRTDTVRVDYDPDRIRERVLRDRLASLGYPVRSRDEAFENRRREQWADARIATGVLGGLMVLVPYVAVLYPAQFGIFYAPSVLARLEAALSSAAVVNFYLNLAILTAIVVGFTGKPLLERAWIDVRAGVVTPDLAIAAPAIGLYAYSSLVAFAGIGGTVRFDVVVGLIVIGAIARRFGVWTTDRQPIDEPDDLAAERVERFPES